MGKINVLSFAVANLIAAGEVVDRPASVIKELMENSIDSGATSITVEIQHGGVTLMRVTDNGCGMTPEDLPVSIRRHATSKIRTAGDLDGISTLGFRGEALAAIASVSKLRILSRTPEAEFGAMLETTGGENVTVTEQGCAVGTTVLVEDLFANVPARRKFLKKDVTETVAVTAYVEKIALSHPEIAVRLITDGNLKLETAGDGRLKSAVYALYGRDFTNRLLPVNTDNDGIAVWGYIGRTDNYKPMRNGENFFVNGRYVKSKTAIAALEQAYTSYMPPEKFPCCVLFVRVSPARVDVNVHPAKLEVKFSNEKAIFDAVYYAVRSTLEANVTRPELRTESSRVNPNPFAFPGGKVSSATVPVENARAESLTRRQLSYDLGGRTQPQPDIRPAGNLPQNPPPARVTAEEYLAMVRGTAMPKQPVPTSAATVPAQPKKMPENADYRQQVATNGQNQDGTVGQSAGNAVETPLPTAENPIAETVTESIGETAQNTVPEPTADNTVQSVEEPEKVAREYRIIGSAFRSYVLVEVGETLLVIDQHAAHERILFEELKAGLHKTSPVSQMLLLPVEVMMTSGEVDALKLYADELQKIGFSLRFARNTVMADAIPEGVATSAVGDMLSIMAGRLLDNTGSVKLTRDIIFEKALYQAACKAAIKAGRSYAEEHIEWIVKKLMELPDITFCPHGRPVAMELTKSALDRQFDRTGF